ncbi:hypothetical protein KGF66_15375 [Lactiplantibacillus pentosus]|uniref:hypothetical protein n=1 Tax=Lactiplantibacillus pentosus TaxID=1589 RepID=UPI001C1EF0C9|nr:hypothetical protein [Lactiplantibacillus pentosus]MBU7488655.1 hypothetical protein [Lactiplantibacillus pentosus]MBU7501740.1 hypothetical protein [Lactiplantibacillus pentosus]MBU7508241.1 hypothetical protein [Lactiplantibacillus pentosus]MBU7511450.1 hypothetical protein [Lactiplantibacillus pentosus]MBU7517698.1 hypothetical protein [Lactiplantibacillus pentosus]
MYLLLLLLFIFAFLYLIPQKKEKILKKQNKSSALYHKYSATIKKFRYICLLVGFFIVVSALYTLIIKKDLRISLMFEALLFLFVFIQVLTHLFEQKLFKKYTLTKKLPPLISKKAEIQKAIGLYGSAVCSLLLSLFALLLSITE